MIMMMIIIMIIIITFFKRRRFGYHENFDVGAITESKLK